MRWWLPFVLPRTERLPPGPWWRLLVLVVALLCVVGLAGVEAGEQVYFNDKK